MVCLIEGVTGRVTCHESVSTRTALDVPGALCSKEVYTDNIQLRVCTEIGHKDNKKNNKLLT